MTHPTPDCSGPAVFCNGSMSIVYADGSVRIVFTDQATGPESPAQARFSVVVPAGAAAALAVSIQKGLAQMEGGGAEGPEGRQLQ